SLPPPAYAGGAALRRRPRLRAYRCHARHFAGRGQARHASCAARAPGTVGGTTVSRTPLETRLRSLAIEPPDDLVARAQARVRAFGRPRHRLTPALVAALVAAALVVLATANEAAAYLVPAYGRADAGTPPGRPAPALLRARRRGGGRTK